MPEPVFTSGQRTPVTHWVGCWVDPPELIWTVGVIETMIQWKLTSDGPFTHPPDDGMCKYGAVVK